MNSFCHIEIPTVDLKKAVKFYGKIFGWEFQEYPEMQYVTFRTGHAPNGGLMLVKKMPRSAQVNAYVEVDDIDLKLKEIRKARGKVVMKKSPVGEMGFMAQFLSPDGCRLALWQAAPEGDATMADAS